MQIAIINVIMYEMVCEYTNQYMLKLLLGNNPDHNKKLQINIMSTLSNTDNILSVLNISNAAMLERTYNMKESSTWFKPTMPNSFNCSLLYPIIHPIRNITMK